MSEGRFRNIITAASILFFLAVGIAYAYDDGFTLSRKAEGRHFTIYYSPKLDLEGLAQQLNISPADKILASGSTKGLSGLVGMVDTLFTQVCDILDMQLYSYTGIIKICQDYSQLSQLYRNLFNADLGGMLSFYVNDSNTIYISQENFKRSVLGHEIAHAIIAHYFVVQSPVKVQEVLAGYVEYQLRKQ